MLFLALDCYCLHCYDADISKRVEIRTVYRTITSLVHQYLQLHDRPILNKSKRYTLVSQKWVEKIVG
jgi:hypothetical protein